MKKLPLKNSFLIATITFVLSISFLLMSNSKIDNVQNAFGIKKNYYNSLKPNQQYELSKNYGSSDNASELFQLVANRTARDLGKKTRNANTPWTSEGPYNVGGRINDIEIDPNNTSIIYVATPAAGIFKSTDNGITWTQKFNQESNLNLSSVEVDPNNSNILYVGTGDKAYGNGSKVGNGIYKSTDGGDTWSNIGLPNSGCVSRITINPNNSNEIYAAALGSNLVANTSRGLYKSTDAGMTWTKVLNISAIAGIHDVIIDKNNSNIVFATAMSANHAPNAQTGIYKSTDAGANWSKLTNGLPTGAIAKMTMAQAHNNGLILYAAVCNSSNSFGGFYKSSDGGSSWAIQYSGSAIDYRGFGWYFGELRVNPTDDNKVYNMNVNLNVSNNGGQSWGLAAPDVYGTGAVPSDIHADVHDLVFIGNSGTTALLATDGGIHKTTVGGSSSNGAWTNLTNMPITQYYETNYNPSDVGNYYAGAQDNGTSLGSSTNGLSNWGIIPLGDGFRPDFDPTNPNAIYVESQFGNIIYIDFNNQNNTSFLTQYIQYQRNWNTPYITSKANASTMFLGADRILENNSVPFSTFWNDISPPLTGSPFTISTIDQSSLNTDIFYAGSNDARLFIRKTATAPWTSINTGLPNFAVSSVIASPNSVSNVFVSHTGYNNNNKKGHIHFSSDYGTTWTSLHNNTLPDFAINDIWVKADGTDSSIVVATEGGVYSTQNRGMFWSRVGNNMPIINVTDLDYSVGNNKLVAATFSMGIFTIDMDSVFSTTNVATTTKSILSENNLSIYPNPVLNSLNLDLSKLDNKKFLLNLFNSRGQLLISKNIQTKKNTIDLSMLSNGIYFISLIDEADSKNRIYRKIVKQ